MNKINTEVLKQFQKKGLIINEGIAVDAMCRQAAFNIKRGASILGFA